MKENNITLGIENSRLKQELSLYKNQNIQGLKKLNTIQLEKLGQNVEILLKNIRTQMNILVLKHEFDESKSIFDRVDKALGLREQMVHELVELTNDFFEPNLQLNTTLYDEDESIINNINEQTQLSNHNIHYKENSQNNYLFEKNTKPVQIQTINLNKKFISGSPLVISSPTRETTKFISYKEDYQQNQLTNQTENNSLTNLNFQPSIQKYQYNQQTLNNVNENNLDQQLGISQSQNFGTFENYFNQINSRLNKYSISQSVKQTADNNIIDFETQNQTRIQSHKQACNQTIEESSKPSISSDCLSSKLIYDIIGQKNKQPLIQKDNIFSQTSITPENQIKGEEKTQFNSLNLNNNENVLKITNNLLNQGSNSNNYISNQTISSQNKQFVQQQIIKSQQTDERRSSCLEITDNTYLNTILEQTYQPQNNQSTQKNNFSSSINFQDANVLPKSQLHLQNQQSDNIQQSHIGQSQFAQSPMNVHNLKIDQKQFSLLNQNLGNRLSQQGQNFVSNLYQANDINTEAFALTKDFQEPFCIDNEEQKIQQYNTQNQNKWDNQKSNRINQTSKERMDSNENKYSSTYSHKSNSQLSQQINLNYQCLQNQTNQQSKIYENVLSEKKLVEKLFGKENKQQTGHSIQSQNKINTREGQNQQQKGHHKYQNSLSQQKQPQCMKKNLSQNEINSQKLLNNHQSISNSIYSQISQQHQQNKQIVQQLMGSQNNSLTQNFQSTTLNSHHNYSSSNTQPPIIQQSQKYIDQQINQNHVENSQSYLNVDNNFKTLNLNPTTK